MKRMIIGVTGQKNSGKTMVTKLLKSYLLKKNNCTVFTIAFADALKRGLAEIFGWELEKLDDQEFKASIDPLYGITPREAMVAFGHYAGRKKLGEDIWIKSIENEIKSNLHFHYIISDVRYNNEAKFIRDMGGIIIKVYCQKENYLMQCIRNFFPWLTKSELGIADKYIDHWIKNQKISVKVLQYQIENLFNNTVKI